MSDCVRAKDKTFKKNVLEICVDSLTSAINAQLGGADRIELCSSLCLDGLTPSMGLFLAIRSRSDIPIYCMLRPRHGDFVYDDDEMNVVLEDLKAFKAAGADGFVFGALDSNGDIDENLCRMVLNEAGSIPVTFHRAFDYSSTDNWKLNLRKLIDLGFKSLLTSGFLPKAYDGKENIKNLIEEANGQIDIIVGSGVDENNLKCLMEVTRSERYHGSASEPISGHVTEGQPQLKLTSTKKVRAMRNVLDSPDSIMQLI